MTVVEERSAVVSQSQQIVVADQDFDMYRKHFAKQAPAHEWEIFLQKCRLMGLNPMLNEVYLVKRGWGDKESYTTQVSITGLIALAERTNRYEGQTDPIYYDADLNEYAVWPISKGPYPYAIKIGVNKKGFRQASSAISYFHERAQYKSDGGLMPQWKSQGIHMLLKCALAAAIRWAFQETCGNVYIHEEMQAADTNASEISIVPGYIVSEENTGLQSTAGKSGQKAVQQKSISAPPASHEITSREIFAKGKEKGLWDNSKGFYIFASAELGVLISADSKLSTEQRVQLNKAVDEEKPIAQVAS